jgi:hypothetical protein
MKCGDSVCFYVLNIKNLGLSYLKRKKKRIRVFFFFDSVL